MADAAPPPTSVPSVAPAAAAPAEVAVDAHQSAPPSPVGSQAPDKPVGDHQGSTHRPESRREAIQRAFDRAAKAEPAKPRMGHNNPPEAMTRERTREQPRPQTIDLRKRPADQPEQPTPEKREPDARPRAEHGHFAPKQAQPQTGQQSQPGAQQRVNPLPQGAPY